MSEKNYTVSVSFPAGIAATSRSRAGIEVLREGGYVGPLTKEQLAEIEADPLLSISEGVADGDGSVEATAEAAKIIADAEAKAADILKQAQDEATKTAADANAAADSVAAEAKSKGEETVRAAQDQAKQIIADAKTKPADTQK